MHMSQWLFDDDSVLENCAKEIEMAWRFMEEQTGLEFHWEELKKHIELQNKQNQFEREKWLLLAVRRETVLARC